MADLVLPLKREYFEAIRDGSKTEEYRLPKAAGIGFPWLRPHRADAGLPGAR